MGASLLGGGGAKAQTMDYEYDNKPRQEQVSDYSDYQLDSIGRSYIRDFYKHSDKMEKRFEHEISAIDSNAQYKSWIMTNALVRDDNNQIFELTDDFDAMSAKERAATLRRLFDLRGDRDYRNYCLVDAPNRKNVVYIIYIPDMIKVATRFDI